MPIVVGAGSFLLFLSLALNAVALLVPYWYVTMSAGKVSVSSGLWASCVCRWHYSSLGTVIDDENIKDWFKASQWLYAIAVVLIVLASVMVLSVGCLRKTVGTTIAKVAGSLMIIAAVLGAIAVTLFGLKGKSDLGLTLSGDQTFAWGLWIAVSGIVFSVVSGIFLFVRGGRVSHPEK